MQLWYACKNCDTIYSSHACKPCEITSASRFKLFVGKNEHNVEVAQLKSEIRDCNNDLQAAMKTSEKMVMSIPSILADEMKELALTKLSDSYNTLKAPADVVLLQLVKLVYDWTCQTSLDPSLPEILSDYPLPTPQPTSEVAKALLEVGLGTASLSPFHMRLTNTLSLLEEDKRLFEHDEESTNQLQLRRSVAKIAALQLRYLRFFAHYHELLEDFPEFAEDIAFAL
ncbi:hypothetical protein BJ508DRAFT_315899 [Ascobolus immersus RN42]|uniref:Uncharacterized protein n=1 Tax=Ascobolus immersus RN42 TaxID=1160509 RepID=A0A3N4HG77_ASCIM|nr:hypothetical protein BJ508DRAFT_315899 [Ascobolus immersus RN42]